MKKINFFAKAFIFTAIAILPFSLSSCKSFRDKFDEDITLTLTMHEDSGSRYVELSWKEGYDSYEVYRYDSTESRGSSYLLHHGDKIAETEERAYFDHSSEVYSCYENGKYIYYWIEDRYGNTSNIAYIHK